MANMWQEKARIDRTHAETRSKCSKSKPKIYTNKKNRKIMKVNFEENVKRSVKRSSQWKLE